MNIFINYPIDDSLIETFDHLMKECDFNDNNCKERVRRSALFSLFL